MSSAGHPDITHWHASAVSLPSEGQRVIFPGLHGEYLPGQFIAGRFVSDPDHRKKETTRQVCEFTPSMWRPEVVQ